MSMNEDIQSIARQCLQPRACVNELSLLQLRPYVESFLDKNWLEYNLEEYKKWALKNSAPFLQSTQLHRPSRFNILVASIWAARYWESIYKKESPIEPPGGAKRLLIIACSLAILELSAGHLLDTEAREHLKQRLQDPYGFWGVIHELNTFAYFIRKGATVQPHFLKKASPDEIILHWHEIDIPVQCKVKPPGSGRVISQEKFTTLASSIARDARSAGKKLLVRIGSTGQIRDEDIDFLRHQVAKGVGSSIGAALVTNNKRTFTLQSQPLSGQFARDTIQQYLSSFSFQVGMIIGEPAPRGNAYDAVAVVGIEADLEEKAWRSLKDSIKKGAKQLQGGARGILAIHYADPVNDFEALRPDHRPMVVHIGQLLDNFPYIGAVILTSEPDLQLPGADGLAKLRIYHRKPWPFPNDFLLDN